MTSPRISVIVPAFNAAAVIRETLSSVVAQDIDDVEMVVVDDGSLDDTAAIVQEEFPRAQLIRQNRGGPSRARNVGTRAASGEFVQYLDADDLLAPGKLATQVAALERSGAAVAYGDWQRLEPQADGTWRHGELISRRLGVPEHDLLTDFWCPPAAYLFTRSIVDAVGGWSVNLPVIQDARFALDCALQGGEFVRCPGLMALYRVSMGDSVSQRDPAQFRRDCLLNASEVEQWWATHGGLTEERRSALLSAYLHVARASFGCERTTFEAACAALERLRPRFAPDAPLHLALAARLLGYRRAEYAALAYRRIKRLGRS